jgi:hypothetical protein
MQCEACYTPLAAVETATFHQGTCPQCGASVQQDATFCGQCGFNLKANLQSHPSPAIPETNIPAPLEWAAPTVAIASAANAIEQQTPVTVSNPLMGAATQIQLPSVSLLHVQTNIPLEVPNNLEVIHIGKPNDVVPPDIDISGFPNSEVVSRVHADLRVEEGLFYLEDTGSSNGTYVNHVPLPAGNRHRLRPGDRIAFGKGDKVTFIFQMANT